MLNYKKNRSMVKPVLLLVLSLMLTVFEIAETTYNLLVKSIENKENKTDSIYLSAKIVEHNFLHKIHTCVK